MKILQVHNFYGSSAPSGETRVLESERAMLSARGHEVELFQRHSDELRERGALGSVHGAIATPWNPFAARRMRLAVERYGTDIVHAHNTFPLVSPAIFSAIGNRAARVLTLHNYRLLCPAAIPMRDGGVCTDCIERHSVVPALRHGCYRDSRIATLPLATSVALHRSIGTWRKHVDGFIALSEFQRDLVIRGGLPGELVHLKPNFYPGEPRPVPWAERKPQAVYVGRLSPEKGVDSLVRAWTLWGEMAPQLTIIGDGESRETLKRLAAANPRVQIHFPGPLESESAQEQIGQSRLLIMPSQCFEGFPMAIAEAFALGTPVAASDIGPLPSLVKEGEHGILFKPGDPQSLLDRVRAAWHASDDLERYSGNVRLTFEQEYTEDVNYRRLMAIYESAIEVNRSRGGSS